MPDKGLIGKGKIKAATTPEKPVSEENADPIELEEAVRSFTLVLKDPLGNAVTSPVYTEDDFESSSGFPVKIKGAVTNGIYPLQVIAVESFKVTAAAKDLFGESSLKVKYSDDDGKRYEARVPYQYSTTLEGRVTAGKRPIAGATITATSHKEVIISIIVSPAASHGSGAEERRALITRSRPTDSHGKYRIVVNHQGPFTIQAEKPGYKSYPHEFPIKKADGKYDFETGRTHVGIDLVLTQLLTGLSYRASTLELLPDKALTPDQLADLRPSITPAGAVVTYKVDPALPAGLELDPSTGEITGTPTAITAAGDYLVRAKGNDEYAYAGEASHTINVRVGAVTRFTLELKDHLGNPIPGYRAANFTSSSGAAVEFDTTAPAPPEGSCKLQVLTSGSGDFTVTVAAKGLFGEKESAEINPAAAAGTNYRVTVPYRYTTTVSGRVTRGRRNTPIDDADISVRSTGSGANERLAVISSRPAKPKTDNLGRYSITVNHQGDFNIRAEKAGYSSPAAPVTVSGTGGTEPGKNIVLTQPVTGLSYTASSLVLVQNEALTPDQAARLRPRIIPAGAVIKYSVSPRLPKGLILNAYTGEITGTPTEESQIHTGTDYIGRDYIVTAQGHTAAGYSGSASHTINIRVGKALPDTMGYDTPFFFYGERIILDHEISVERLPEDTTVGFDDEDFHAEFVKIPKNGVCWDLNIAADGRITLDDGGGSTGMILVYHYKVKVIGKGRYVGKRTVDFEIHTTGRIY